MQRLDYSRWREEAVTVRHWVYLAVGCLLERECDPLSFLSRRDVDQRREKQESCVVVTPLVELKSCCCCYSLK